MVSVGLGIPNHDVLPGVSTADHHTQTVAGDLNLADLAENLHASLTSVGGLDHNAEATQGLMEAEATTLRTMRPSIIRHSPGVAKAWCHIDRSAGTPSLSAGSYNIASLTDAGVGQTTVNFTDNMSTALYVVVANAEAVDSTADIITVESLAVGSFLLECRDEAANLLDTTNYMCVAFGDQ